ncbi:hypothetical protein V494_05774 [Pseudogymnoascus sp. VKM F-4513 (FW-928)]|nr:hypothetical protein V494_05774 [Pseudogymnoascus sp. VKM F-4513 (FW-928)]
MATPDFICANWRSGSADCKEVGRYTCKNCLLVVYCGADCQKSHWSVHKIDCKSFLGKEIWTPDWVLKNRQPAFIHGGETQVQFGGTKYLWGNVPSLDVLQLRSNEGNDYKGQLRLLFAASGDFRNVIKSIARLPESYKQSIDVTINDRDIDIVARNVIMLLIAMTVDNIDEAADCILHIWYSTLIRKSDLEILQQRIRPLIEDICKKIKGKLPSTTLAKTWTFGQRSMRLVLQKSSWDKLLAYMDTPDGLTMERANKIRAAVTLAESRKDYRDRHLLFQSNYHRIAKHRYWVDGLLLPFGSPRDDFKEPNPTFFQTADTWPIRDNGDPLNGWSLKEVEDTSSGPARNDIYGKLFYYVRIELRSFILRLSNSQISFCLFQEDASELPNHLKTGSFSRIEVSNISDGGYLGIHRTVHLMAPLLQSPLVNPHATLITLFMNAIEEKTTSADQVASMTPHSPETKRVIKYLPPTNNGISMGSYSTYIIKVLAARDIVATYDHIFKRYENDLKFSEMAQYLGGAVKENHTIIEKWPFRLKLQPGQPGAQEEFDRLLCGGVSGKERLTMPVIRFSGRSALLPSITDFVFLVRGSITAGSTTKEGPSEVIQLVAQMNKRWLVYFKPAVTDAPLDSSIPPPSKIHDITLSSISPVFQNILGSSNGEGRASSDFDRPSSPSSRAVSLAGITDPTTPHGMIVAMLQTRESIYLKVFDVTLTREYSGNEDVCNFWGLAEEEFYPGLRSRA